MRSLFSDTRELVLAILSEKGKHETRRLFCLAGLVKQNVFQVKLNLQKRISFQRMAFAPPVAVRDLNE